MIHGPLFARKKILTKSHAVGQGKRLVKKYPNDHGISAPIQGFADRWQTERTAEAVEAVRGAAKPNPMARPDTYLISRKVYERARAASKAGEEGCGTAWLKSCPAVLATIEKWFWLSSAPFTRVRNSSTAWG